MCQMGVSDSGGQTQTHGLVDLVIGDMTREDARKESQIAHLIYKSDVEYDGLLYMFSILHHI